MSKRTYAQFCALARAFDVVGERWTALVLRELAMGPRRYADLLEGLPGVGTSLLAQRLRDLEADGVIRKVYLPPPAARQAYELTDDGLELAEALVPIARWGAKRLGSRREGESFSLSWLLLFLRAAANTEAAQGVHDVYEFHLDTPRFGRDEGRHSDVERARNEQAEQVEQVFHVIVDDGHVDAQTGPAPRPPDLVVRTDVETFVAIGTGIASASDPRVLERMDVQGDTEAARRSLAILGPAAPTALAG